MHDQPAYWRILQSILQSAERASDVLSTKGNEEAHQLYRLALRRGFILYPDPLRTPQCRSGCWLDPTREFGGPGNLEELQRSLGILLCFSDDPTPGRVRHDRSAICTIRPLSFFALYDVDHVPVFDLMLRFFRKLIQARQHFTAVWKDPNIITLSDCDAYTCQLTFDICEVMGGEKWRGLYLAEAATLKAAEPSLLSGPPSALTRVTPEKTAMLNDLFGVALDKQTCTERYFLLGIRARIALLEQSGFSLLESCRQCLVVDPTMSF